MDEGCQLNQNCIRGFFFRFVVDVLAHHSQDIGCFACHFVGEFLIAVEDLVFLIKFVDDIPHTGIYWEA